MGKIHNSHELLALKKSECGVGGFEDRKEANARSMKTGKPFTPASTPSRVFCVGKMVYKRPSGGVRGWDNTNADLNVDLNFEITVSQQHILWIPAAVASCHLQEV